MILKTGRRLLVPCLVLVVFCAARADEFALDNHTLFLAHFNDSVNKADYAMGWDRFAGSGARLTDGYYGKAVDLRGILYNPNFLAESTSRMPYRDTFGVWTRGNVSYEQGTYEFWFKVAPDGTKHGYGGQSLFFTHYFQPVAKQFIGTYLTRHSMSWSWQFLKGEPFKGRVRFDPPLDPDHWHHYAMCWSPGEMVIYIDGRPVGAHDMTGKLGLILAAQTHNAVAMGGIALDELRISSIVRYEKDFEPAWRDGKRPAYAFKGAPDIQRYPAKAFEPYVPSAAVPDSKVLLLEGIERKPLTEFTTQKLESKAGESAWEERYAGKVLLRYHTSHADECDRWDVEFVNLTNEELWLEALLTTPVPFSAKEYFDMSWVHHDLSAPRRRDEYVSSLPFVAAAGESKFLGIGIDPHINLSALISEWVPQENGGVIRQGTRVVLDPKASYSLRFVLVRAEGDFGVLDAIAKYHSLFPDLYKQKPDVPVYSYMPVCRYFEYLSYPDLARLCYMGNQWGHGPGHCKGDEWGTQKYWDMPKDPKRPDHAYAAKMERLWKSIDGLREQFLVRSKRSYDSYYTLRRSHYLPNWAMRFVVEDLWPEGMIGGDRLVCGQYYPQMYYANEFNTPLGRHYKQTTTNIMKHIGHISPGFINDMCHTSPFRFTDAIARKTPGCAFSKDRGRYLVGAFGHVDRYKLINDFVDPRGFRQSIWSDGGVVSYMLLAHSAAGAIESGVPFLQWPGPELAHVPGRYMIGEKPFVLHWSKENEWFGRFFKPKDFTPKTLRDYYRYCFAQLMLSCLRHGIYLPHDCIGGQQWMMEHNPILVESIVNGRKIVPGAKVPAPLFVVRSGEGMDSLLVIGNEQPKPITCDVQVVNRYFGKGAPIFGRYFDGELRQEIGPQMSKIKNVTVEPRSMRAFKILGLLAGEGSCEVTSSFTGDGITMKVSLKVKGSTPARLTLNPFSPIYGIAGVTVNGKPAAGVPLDLPAGKVMVAVQYKNRVFEFSRDDWDAVELVKDGKTNFCLIARTDSPFNSGTAGMLNQFIEQYDEEDGVLGNLKKAEIFDAPPADFDGWKIFVKPNVDVMPSRVRIDRAAKAIHVEGKSSGEARRAMVVLLRLIDRKYPHIGRFYSLKYYGGDHPKMIRKRLKCKETQEFFLHFADKEFLIKPILNPQHEDLYAKGNADFQGKYPLRGSPYLFEPTYSENYVYGYTGQ
ncbi:MAG: LamG domain-containing protein [Planctomycetes bacterium]|nr:LamG domain-containing protein [Planctomycetota bacterium]